MERRGNDSPHRLIPGVLEGMDRSKFRLVVFSRDYVADYADAGQVVLRAAEEVVIMRWHPFVTGLADPFADRKIIAAAKVDVLFYVALGNTLWSHLLALGRLAPVQLSFGHGHPVTSGSPAMDYFVSSELFETRVSIDAREARRIAGTASDISKTATTTARTGPGLGVCDDDDGGDHGVACSPSETQTHTPDPDDRQLHPRGSLSRVSKQRDLSTGGNGRARGGGGDGEQAYAEQLVLFDSVTASLPEVLEASQLPSYEWIATLAARGISTKTSTTLGSLLEGHHLYHCIQHSKKFHPDFDQVLRGVLQSDPAAKILLATAAEMLAVVTNCRVMLDKFPWGAGITAMEALLAGVPVVTLPAQVSVLQLASGQLVELGVADELVASDVDDMVKKAVRLASDTAYRETVSTTILPGK